MIYMRYFVTPSWGYGFIVDKGHVLIIVFRQWILFLHLARFASHWSSFLLLPSRGTYLFACVYRCIHASQSCVLHNISWQIDWIWTKHISQILHTKFCVILAFWCSFKGQGHKFSCTGYTITEDWVNICGPVLNNIHYVGSSSDEFGMLGTKRSRSQGHF